MAKPLSVADPNQQIYLSLIGTGIMGTKASPRLEVFLGSRSVPVIGAGPQSQFIGLEQINIGPVRASSAGSGIQAVLLRVDGQAATNVVTVEFQDSAAIRRSFFKLSRFPPRSRIPGWSRTGRNRFLKHEFQDEADPVREEKTNNETRRSTHSAGALVSALAQAAVVMGICSTSAAAASFRSFPLESVKIEGTELPKDVVWKSPLYGWAGQ